MHPAIAATIIGILLGAVLNILFFAFVSKSRDAARETFEKQFKEQLESALAKWELGFRESLKAQSEEWTLSARDYLKLTAAIEKQLNGRYWLATEARTAMKDLGSRLDDQTQRLHDRISRLGDEMDEKLVRLSDDLKGKADKD